MNIFKFVKYNMVGEFHYLGTIVFDIEKSHFHFDSLHYRQLIYNCATAIFYKKRKLKYTKKGYGNPYINYYPS